MHAMVTVSLSSFATYLALSLWWGKTAAAYFKALAVGVLCTAACYAGCFLLPRARSDAGLRRWLLQLCLAHTRTLTSGLQVEASGTTLHKHSPGWLQVDGAHTHVHTRTHTYTVGGLRGVPVLAPRGVVCRLGSVLTTRLVGQRHTKRPPPPPNTLVRALRAWRRTSRAVPQPCCTPASPTLRTTRTSCRVHTQGNTCTTHDTHKHNATHNTQHTRQHTAQCTRTTHTAHHSTPHDTQHTRTDSTYTTHTTYNTPRDTRHATPATHRTQAWWRWRR